MKENKIKKVSLPDQVCNAIKEKILDNEWKENQLIPSENELAEMFGVNRLSVRMALQKLNTIGVLETRAGNGTYVRRFDLQEYIAGVGDFYETPKMLEDISSFRKIIEKEWIRLAVVNYDELEVQRLEEIVEAQMQFVDGKEAADLEKEGVLDHLLDDEAQYLEQLARMSKNSVYPIIFATVRGLIRKHSKSIYDRLLCGEVESPALLKDGKFHQDGFINRVVVQSIRNKDYKAAWDHYDRLDF